ncbi:MAG: protein kinase [Peptococcaceae bacterium BRH_c8a]|nr:MAG: protein kinase [Peptococcaceae bacterium BRH_c8a]
MIGKMLGNRYEIQEKLGGGGMAIVYKARDTFLNRLVTIKILRPEFTSDDDFVARFRREAQAVASLSHPNIVNIHDVGQEDAIHYLVMEYVRGDNLKNVIKQKGYLEPIEAVRIAVQVSEALEHAHQNNIVHRDVKPHNILITTEGRAKLTDFGIAMEATSSTITRTDTIMGSVHYLSPEQARGETATPKSDIYAVGILLYEMLTGKQPYSGDSPIAVALKHIQETPLPVDEVNPDVPTELANVVRRAMDKKPELRYRNAGDLARHLESALEDTGQNTVILPVVGTELAAAPGAKTSDPYQAESAETADHQKEAAIPKTWTWIAVAVLVIGLMVGGVYGFFNYMDVPDITVKNVVGMTEAEARAELEALDLGVKVQEKYDDEKEGIVIAQDHGPDDPKVKPQRVITITVSKGQEMMEVPELLNRSVSEAVVLLDQAKLTLTQPPAYQYSDDTEKDSIIEQSPAAHEKAPRGFAVRITVSKGPEPKMQTIPDLRGKTLRDAASILSAKNLVLNEAEAGYEDSTDYPANRITSHTPGPNTEVEEGTEISVVLSRGPGPVEKKVNVEVKDVIPDDGRVHSLEIVVEDLEGRKLRYADSHDANDKVRKKITYLGRGVLQVFVDGELVQEEELP